MDRRFFSFLLALHIVCLVCVTSRPFSTNDGHHHVVHQGIDDPSAIEVGDKSVAKVEEMKEAAELKELSKIGSSPPSCEHKCFGCMPCEAIQVPTTTGRVGVQYANYEPEGWKCKCGPTFYSP